MGKNNTAHRPSQSDQQYVTNSKGEKVINTAYKPSKKSSKNSSYDSSSVASSISGNNSSVDTEYYPAEIDMDSVVTDSELIDYFGGPEEFDEDDFDYKGEFTESAYHFHLEQKMNDDREYLRDTASRWAANNANESDNIVIEGGPVNWMGSSGSKMIPVEDFIDNPRESASIGGDVSQKWSFKEDGTVNLVQSSHDVPTGALFTVRPATKQEEAEAKDEY